MRILWLAVADARGHLMRAHLCRRALALRGIEVDIVTTSVEGAAFAAAMGSPARVAFEDWRVEFDDAQCLDRASTHRRAVRYVLDPTRMRADRRALGRLRYDLFVNDFHPLMLWDRPLGGSTPVVHVHGENLWGSIARPFRQTRLAPLDRLFQPAVTRLRAHGDAVIVHRPHAAHRVVRRAQTFELPPIVAAPSTPALAVREALGVAPGQKLAVAYLNPHFKDSALALAIESACDRAGHALYAVGEGFAGRPRWRAFDPHWVDKVAAADVLISPPGMGSVGLHRTLGTPFLMLLTDQPEQRANARALSDSGAVGVEFGPDAVLDAALATAMRASGYRRPERIDELWADCIEQIAGELIAFPSLQSELRTGT